MVFNVNTETIHKYIRYVYVSSINDETCIDSRRVHVANGLI